MLLAASFVATGWLELRPKDDHYVAAIFPPWWSAARSTDAVITAEGAITGWGSLGSIVLTRSDRDGFGVRLRAAGAILLLDPVSLEFCGRIGSKKNAHSEGSES